MPQTYEPQVGDQVVATIRGRVKNLTAGGRCVVLVTEFGDSIYLPQLGDLGAVDIAPARGNVRVIGGAA